MLAIRVSDRVAGHLRQLVGLHDGDSSHAIQSLRRELDEPPTPLQKGAKYETDKDSAILSYECLIAVAKWADGVDEATRDRCALSSLLQGAQVAIAKKPEVERSPELIALLRKIELQQEEQGYAEMIQSTQETHSRGALMNVHSWQTPSRNEARDAKAEEQEWLEIRQQLSAIANVLISMAAVATAVWWAGGTADPIWKTLVAIPLCVLVAVAEVVLYARYWTNMRIRREQMQSKKKR